MTTTFFQDTFTGANGTLITSRAADIGGNWESIGTGDYGTIFSNTCYSNNTNPANAASYRTAAIAGDANCDVYAAWETPFIDCDFGVWIRQSGASGGVITGYFF